MPHATTSDSTTATTTTTGFCHMWDGTSDGSEVAWFDWANGTTNCKPLAQVNVTVEDIRSLDVKPTLMKNGFELVDFHTALSSQDFLDLKSKGADPRFREETPFPEQFRAEVLAALRKATGCEDVITCNMKIRTMHKDAAADMASGRKKNENPVSILHTDLDQITYDEFLEEGKVSAEDVARLRGYKKWAQVNLWRPINCEVQRWPLLFVNKSKIPEWSYEKFTGQPITKNDPRVNLNGIRAKSHDNLLINDERYSYQYASKVTLDEALIFFTFHSDPSKVVPHGAFWDDSTSKNAPVRISLEVRALVGYD